VLGLLVGLSVTGTALFVAGTGFLGGYTTFSTWMVEAQRLGEDGDWTAMNLYLAASMLAGLLTTGAGWALGGALG
jgi:CrcB protein